MIWTETDKIIWNRFREKRDFKGPQVKTTEPGASIKVTNCSFHLGWILARYDFAENYMVSRPYAKKRDFFIKSVGVFIYIIYICVAVKTRF